MARDMSRKVYMLSKREGVNGSQKGGNIRSRRVLNMNIEVTSNDKFRGEREINKKRREFTNECRDRARRRAIDNNKSVSRRAQRELEGKSFKGRVKRKIKFI